jgi:tRNA wybutosine-synthesizing protein 3
MFENDKASVLGRKDNSIKGSIDARILPVVDFLNSMDCFYTTSSCAGRIMLLVPGKTKKDTEWLFVSHEPITLRHLNASMHHLPKNDVWFRQEAMILHVCCQELDDAKRLMDDSMAAGFKRSGIISLKPRIMMEIVGSSHFETILARKGKVLFSNTVLEILISEANKRLKKNFEQIALFNECIEKREK